jgi:HEAT repeat protein
MADNKRVLGSVAAHPITTALAVLAVSVPVAFAVPAMSQQEQDLDAKIDSLIQIFAHPKLATDNSEETQKAFKTLIDIGKPAVPKIIDAMLGKNQTVASYCALILEGIGSDALPAVQKRWDDLTVTQKWKFMAFRGKFDYKNVLPFALSSLEEKDPSIRRQAQGFLCFHREARAKSALLKAFKEDLPSHRWDIIGCIFPYDDKEVIDAHIALLSLDSWLSRGEGVPPPMSRRPPWGHDGRPRVIEALGRMKAKASAPALLKVLAEDGPGKAYLGSFILPLLGEFQYKESVPELKRIIASDPSTLAPSLNSSSYVQILAARVLWQLGDKSGRLFLVQLLDGKNSGEKQLACRTVAEFGTKEDIDVLGRRLDDEDWEIRKAACQGLHRITGVRVNQAPGWTESDEHDAPLWKEWIKKNRTKLRK